jgi:hypothetical protein
MDPFSAWFKFNKDQIKSNYFKITSLDDNLSVHLNQKAKQLWSNMTDVEKNEWKNKIEIVEEVKPQQLNKLVLKTPKVKVKNPKKTKKAKKAKKKTKKKAKKSSIKKKSVKNNPAFLPPLINNYKRGPKLRIINEFDK